MDFDLSKMKPLKPADPTETMLFINPAARLTPTGEFTPDETLSRRLPIYTDEHGRKFCRLTDDDPMSYGKREPEQQALVSMLMKGIIPIADIAIEPRPDAAKHSKYEVQNRPHYFSYLMPVGDISTNEDFQNEQRAEIILLAVLFNDGDHSPSQKTAYQTVGSKNLVEGDRAYYFFDVGQAKVREYNFDKTSIDAVMKTYSVTDGVRAHLKRKLEQMIQCYDGEEGLKTIQAQLQYIKDRGENEIGMMPLGTAEQIQHRLMVSAKTFLENI